MEKHVDRAIGQMRIIHEPLIRQEVIDQNCEVIQVDSPVLFPFKKTKVPRRESIGTYMFCV